MFSALQRYDLAPFRGPGRPARQPSQRLRPHYRDIGTIGGCTPRCATGVQLTFTRWKQSWGFGSSTSEAAAIYANLADLNLQRDMHMLSATRLTGGGSSTDVASYVCNARNHNRHPHSRTHGWATTWSPAWRSNTRQAPTR
ncbi:MAG: hypothetical protein U0Z44_22035 [Kouleothrix sp.]